MNNESSSGWLLDCKHFVFMLLIASFTIVSCGTNEDEESHNQIFLTNAENFRSKGQFQASIIESRNAILANPDDSRGYTSLAKIYIEIGQPREAIKVLEGIEVEDVEYVLTIARAYLRAGKLRSAEEVLTHNRARMAENQAAFNLLSGELALALGELERAEEKYNDVLLENEFNIEARLGIASVVAALNDFDRAEILLDQILQTDPENPRAMLFSSSLKVKKGDLAGSEDLLMNALSVLPASDIITPLRYSTLVALRDNLSQQGKTSEALIYSRMLTESMPGVEEVKDKLKDAVSALSKSNFDDARKLLTEIQEQAPGSEQAGTLLGVLEYLQGNNDAAVHQFEQFIDPETATSKTLQVFALAELKLNQPQKVLARLKGQIASSKDSKLVALYGIAALSAEDIKTGEKYLLKAIELDPANGRLRLPLARLYNSQDNPGKALEQIKQAFKSLPDDTLIQAGYIEQLVITGAAEEAAMLVKGIRSSYPHSADTQLLVARYHLSQQNLEEAMKILKKVLSLGESRQARHLIALTNLRLKNYTTAVSEYRTLIRMDVEDSNAYKGLITAYELQDKQEEGISVVKEMLRENGATAAILVLGEFYGRNGDFKQAFALLKQLKDPISIEQTRLTQSLYLAKANQELRDADLDQGRKTILEGLTHSPNEPPLLVLLVKVEIRANQLDEADKVLKELKKIGPDTHIVHVLSGDIAQAKQEFPLATEQYQLAWQIRASDRVAVKLYSSLSQQKNNEKRQVAFLEEWHQKLPDSQISGLTRAGYHMQSGQMDSAKRGYEALIVKFDGLAVAHNNLAWLYGEDELNKALAAGKKAYELAPQNAEIMDTYAWFLYKSGNIMQAKELLVKAADMAPDNKDIRQHLDEVSNRS